MQDPHQARVGVVQDARYLADCAPVVLDLVLAGVVAVGAVLEEVGLARSHARAYLQREIPGWRSCAASGWLCE